MGRYDTAWKDIIQAHFKDFLTFYFPEVAEEVDLSHPPEFLEKELRKLSPAARSPGRYADTLVKVHAKADQAEMLLYCHVEVQGRKEEGFAERLFQYAYRIYDRLKSFPVTLLVLTDGDPAFFPDAFEIRTAGRYLRVEFQPAKLLYLRDRIAECGSDNPFAFVTAAQLEANAVSRLRGSRRRGDRPGLEEGRYELKKRLALQLLHQGYTDEYVESLLKFLDWMLQLPQELEWKLADEISEETGGRTMPYVTSWERMGIERGKREGRLEGRIEEKREVLIRQLTRKFLLTSGEREQVEACDDAVKLDAALDEILFAESKKDVLRFLQ